MTSRQPSLPFWLAHASLQLARRLCPEESRDWRHALAAGLDEIEKPFEALRWATGGIMPCCCGRLAVSDLLRRPGIPCILPGCSLYRRVLALWKSPLQQFTSGKHSSLRASVWSSSYWRADSLVTSAAKREYGRIHLLHPACLP